MSRFKKMEIGYGEPLLMERGDVFTGIVGKISSGKTVHGEADFVTLADEETGGKRSLLISSGLSLFDWENLRGQTVQLVCNGMVKNPKSKRTYKAYDLYVEEPEEVEPSDMPF